MCKIIFFSCFVVISNVFTRFINDSVSLRIEPLTVRNCSPCVAVNLGVLVFVVTKRKTTLSFRHYEN